MSGVIVTYAAQLRTAIFSSMADRGGFVLQGLGMVLNNVFVLAMWFLFFAGFKSVGGWRMPDMALLTALLAMTVGTAGVFAGGYRDLARQIVSGVPEVLLTQPKPLLPRLLANESNVIGWGDIGTSIVLLLTVADIGPGQVGWLVVVIACSLVVYISTAVVFACLAFWLGGARSFARDLTDFMISFSFYPGSIYGGMLKLVVWTVFPAAFIVLVPVEVIRQRHWQDAAILLGGTFFYAALAVAAFEIGLRRFRQGSSPLGDD